MYTYSSSSHTYLHTHTHMHTHTRTRTSTYVIPMTRGLAGLPEIPRVFAYGSSVTFFFNTRKFVHFVHTRHAYCIAEINIYTVNTWHTLYSWDIYVYILYTRCPVVFLLTKRFLIYFCEHISSISRTATGTEKKINKNYTHRSARYARARLTIFPHASDRQAPEFQQFFPSSFCPPFYEICSGIYQMRSKNRTKCITGILTCTYGQ